MAYWPPCYVLVWDHGGRITWPKGVYWTRPEYFRTEQPSCPVQAMKLTPIKLPITIYLRLKPCCDECVSRTHKCTWHFLYFLENTMAQLVDILLGAGQWPVYTKQWMHGCWRTGYARRQAIRVQDIDLIIAKYSCSALEELIWYISLNPTIP